MQTIYPIGYDPDAELHAIEADFENEVAAITAGYTVSEIKSWDQQIDEARRYIADNTSSVPLLRALSINREVPLLELANRIVNKADVYAELFGVALGRKQKRIDQLATL
jgi:hypothetical protein